MTSIETWKVVPNFDRYSVSDLGRVRVVGPHGKITVLKPYFDGSGYHLAGLWDGHRHRTQFKVHHLVMLVFVGPKPDGMQVRHLDGNRTNNRLDNLAYGTASENQIDRVYHGRAHALLTADAVRDIRQRRERGETYVSISKDYGVNYRTVGNVVRGSSWRHVV